MVFSTSLCCVPAAYISFLIAAALESCRDVKCDTNSPGLVDVIFNVSASSADAVSRTLSFVRGVLWAFSCICDKFTLPIFTSLEILFW